MVHEDGSVRWVLELARPIHDEHGDPWMIQGVIFDITERKEAEVSQIARSDRLGSIIEIQRDLAADELAVDAVMRQICERTQELTHADSATVLTLAGDRSGDPSRDGILGRQDRDPGIRRSSLPGWWHRHDESTILSDAQADPRAGALARELGMRSLAAVQLRQRDEKTGQLIAISRKPNAFTRGRSRNAGAPFGRPLIRPQPRGRVRIEASTVGRAFSLPDDVPGGGHRHHLGVARRPEHRCESRVRADVRLLGGGAAIDDASRLHASGRPRRERGAVPGDDGRAS